MSKPPPRFASVRSTERFEFDFIAKQIRWSSGASAASSWRKCSVSVPLRIDVERRAEFMRERLDGDAFTKQFVSDVTKIVHGNSSLGFRVQSSRLLNKKPAGKNPAGLVKWTISRLRQNRRARFLVFVR